MPEGGTEEYWKAKPFTVCCKESDKEESEKQLVENCSVGMNVHCEFKS